MEKEIISITQVEKDNILNMWNVSPERVREKFLTEGFLSKAAGNLSLGNKEPQDILDGMQKIIQNEIEALFGMLPVEYYESIPSEIATLHECESLWFLKKDRIEVFVEMQKIANQVIKDTLNNSSITELIQEELKNKNLIQISEAQVNYDETDPFKVLDVVQKCAYEELPKLYLQIPTEYRGYIKESIIKFKPGLKAILGTEYKSFLDGLKELERVKNLVIENGQSFTTIHEQNLEKIQQEELEQQLKQKKYGQVQEYDQEAKNKEMEKQLLSIWELLPEEVKNKSGEGVLVTMGEFHEPNYDKDKLEESLKYVKDEMNEASIKLFDKFPKDHIKKYMKKDIFNKDLNSENDLLSGFLSFQNDADVIDYWKELIKISQIPGDKIQSSSSAEELASNNYLSNIAEHHQNHQQYDNMGAGAEKSDDTSY